MRFTHHSSSPDWVLDRDRQYEQSPNNKPKGLWLSVDDDWMRWCRDEAIEWAGQCEYEFDVDLSRVLHLGDAEAIDQFQESYVAKVTPTFYGKPDSYRIDWAPLTTEFAGIVIAPYIWERRLDMNTGWYYSWDCASACIWDLTVLS